MTRPLWEFCSEDREERIFGLEVQDTLPVCSTKTQKSFCLKSWGKNCLLLLPLRDTTKYFILQHYTNRNKTHSLSNSVHQDTHASFLEITVREGHLATDLLSLILHVSKGPPSQDQQQRMQRPNKH